MICFKALYLEAYNVLIDQAMRHEYDMNLENGNLPETIEPKNAKDEADKLVQNYYKNQNYATVQSGGFRFMRFRKL